MHDADGATAVLGTVNCVGVSAAVQRNVAATELLAAPTVESIHLKMLNLCNPMRGDGRARNFESDWQQRVKLAGDGVMIEYDEKRQQMVDTENGDYMELILRDREESEYSCSIDNHEGHPYVVANLTSAGTTGLKKWILNSAWEPKRNTPYMAPTNFEVSQFLLDRMVLFLRRLLETRNFAPVLPRFEFVDARKDLGAKK